MCRAADVCCRCKPRVFGIERIRCVCVSLVSTACVSLYVVVCSELLEMTVLDYIQVIRLSQDTLSQTHALVTAIPDTATYADAMAKLAARRVHRWAILASDVDSVVCWKGLGWGLCKWLHGASVLTRTRLPKPV